ncbi:MAG: Gfo/Idh/MocA family oxidoreductase [Clostridiaceae bacterium]|nr:Gfo/Idh/MocA family oxidoreductase [Clostridiaceae bacterium]
MRTYVFAGASNRALSMYVNPMVANFADDCKILGIFDANVGRARFVAESAGGLPVFENFETMLRETKPDCVIVTTVDVYHSDYIIKSLEMGCDVITEKPMTIDAARCRAILAAEKASGHKVTVTFNYRYAPFVTKIKELVISGAIGNIFSIHFEWLLTRDMVYGAHGTSYFRRWNARMEKSGGLLVHKSTHHFDMVNWIIGQHPAKVSAFGKLNLYGAKNAPFRGERCSTCEHKEACEFYYELSDFEKKFYAENEQYDGYMKDNCIYADDINIYDTMAVTVQYDKGAVMSYSLNATTPYEGWHMVLNGSKGRIEATNYETGVQSNAPESHIKVFDLNDNITDYNMTKSSGGHGGGDERLRRMLFLEHVPDPLGHGAGSEDGAYSILIGAAANLSIREERIVDIEGLLKG